MPVAPSAVILPLLIVMLLLAYIPDPLPDALKDPLPEKTKPQGLPSPLNAVMPEAPVLFVI